MKLSDFDITGGRDDRDVVQTIKGFNQTASEYPRDRSIHALFAEQAARTPDAVAVIFGDIELSYGELDRRSNQLARFLIELGLEREAVVGILLDRRAEVVVAMLGILKAGGAYLPLNTDLPFQRLEYMLEESRAPVVISEKTHVRLLNKLQWQCPALESIVCVDSRDVHREIESEGGIMNDEIWAYVAEETFDDISGGGWKSSYTGDWLGREVMDDYGDNIRTKLAPYLSRSTRVLEIGCATGISMFRLAPLVGQYCGTDLSPGIIEWCRKEVERRGLDNVSLSCLAAHEIDRLGDARFDVIILNSVMECFPGHNYLRDVIGKCIELLDDQGLLFLGNVWDQDRKKAFIESLIEFKRANPDRGYRTKIEREDELFISRAFLDDLSYDFPEIASIRYSDLLGEHESELSLYSFDALVRVDKHRTAPLVRAGRHRHQYDQRDVSACGDDAIVPRPEEPEIGGRTLAYIIYPSGTRGVPTGVMVEHRAVLRLVWNTNYVDFDASSRVLQTGALAFDASTFEIWGPLLHGGAVCLPVGNSLLDAGELGRYIAQHEIDMMFLTTGLFNQLVDVNVNIFQGLKYILSGGERVSVRHFNAVRSAYPALKLLHVYGPTENTTFTTYFPVEKQYARDIPIGKPISNTTVYVLNDELELLPVGVPGELCAGGDGLARGYLADPALTRQKFIDHPMEPGQRLYRTGDLVRWTAEGNIEFLGRMDDQVKIRGFRIEPGEIESQLLGHPAVKEAIVIALEPGDAGAGASKELCAYVAGSELDIEDLRQHLAIMLPEYMVPSHFVIMEKLPLAPTGKVDKAALPAPERSRFAAARGAQVAPETKIERALAGIWEQVLGVDGVGVTDDFFALGGHSIKVIKMISLIEKAMQVSVPLMIVFKTPTIRELGNYISDRLELEARGVDLSLAEGAMIRLSGESNGRPVLAFPPGSGYSLAYKELADVLAPYAIYGFHFIEADDRLDQYAELIAGQGFARPPILFGFSGGGKLAYQVAVTLEARGYPVAGLVLMDAARYTRAVRFDDSAAMDVADDVLGGITSQALRERAHQKMKAYRAYLYGCVERDKVGCSIDVIEEEGAPGLFRDDTGEVVGGTRIWSELTRGEFAVHAGAGKHRDMLTAAHLQFNAAMVRRIFDRLTRAT